MSADVAGTIGFIVLLGALIFGSKPDRPTLIPVGIYLAGVFLGIAVAGGYQP